MNKTEFINSTNIPESLVEAVIDEFGEWDDDFVEVMNALSWFAAEEVCRAYADLMEDAA